MRHILRIIMEVIDCCLEDVGRIAILISAVSFVAEGRTYSKLGLVSRLSIDALA
jgi:hypothetical protein